MDISLTRRRELRARSTAAELKLWAHLRAKRFLGFKFRRQHPLGPYILDFYCPMQRLAVELDGGQHFTPEALAYDHWREAFLRRCGITVIRFQNDAVFTDLGSVLETILGELAGTSP